MSLIISLLLIALFIEKSIALITVSHMSNVPPLSPVVSKEEQQSGKSKPIHLNEWEKFTLVRDCLKNGTDAFGFSESTLKAAQLLFLSNKICLVIAFFIAISLSARAWF